MARVPSPAAQVMPSVRLTRSDTPSTTQSEEWPTQCAGADSPLPAFLRQPRAEIRQRYLDLEWQQRHRLAQALHSTQPTSEWARVSGDDVMMRNRYINIDPWDKNRVKLKVPEGHSDYINASPIVIRPSRTEEVKKYIATQGPKDSSHSHLWRMVWHETNHVGVIVMLTQPYEAGREKCFEYYPTDSEKCILFINEEDEFGDGFSITVELVKSTYDEDTRSTIRELRLSNGEEDKTVWHFLFTGWPDFLVPEEEDRMALLQLIKLTAVKNTDEGNPRIIHCSAGVGRSGTFIALDYLLDELADGALDSVEDGTDRIADTVDTLRRQRMMMVQGEPQFQFLYDVIKEQWLERHNLQSTNSPPAEL